MYKLCHINRILSTMGTTMHIFEWCNFNVWLKDKICLGYNNIFSEQNILTSFTLSSVLVERSHPTSKQQKSSQMMWWRLYGTIQSCSTQSTQWGGDLWWFGPTLTTNTHQWPWTKSWLPTATTKFSSWAQVWM